MAAHPGKKLDFMGNEFAQLREYDETRPQDWEMLRYPNHDAFRHFRAELAWRYRTLDAFWAREYDPAAFQWLDCAHPDWCACAMLRRGRQTTVFAVFNFGDTTLEYPLTLPAPASCTLLLDTDWQPFGGGTPRTERTAHADPGLTLTLAPFSAQLWQME